MVKLLDVPNDLKPIYYEKAQQAPPSFIISALNIINDSELNYKTASNKRLHVEMCLIRLCYLLQAVQPGSLSEADVKKNFNSVTTPAPTPTPYPPNAAETTNYVAENQQHTKIE